MKLGVVILCHTTPLTSCLLSGCVHDSQASIRGLACNRDMAVHIDPWHVSTTLASIQDPACMRDLASVRVSRMYGGLVFAIIQQYWKTKLVLAMSTSY